MNRLIDAMKELFTAAANSGGELARTASFTLENVDWAGALNNTAPATSPIVDAQLDTACANSGPQGSASQVAAEALLAASDQLTWRTSYRDREGEPDIAAFSRNFTATSIIGAGRPLSSNKVTAGFSLQAPDTYYPGHLHHAEESYWIIGGVGDWKVATQPWFPVNAGDSIFHPSGVRHTMQTNEHAMLTVWLWTSHLDSEVVMVRG
jgi:mannose-6-phosphate isomerase-like protein (cupin superfamily)